MSKKIESIWISANHSFQRFDNSLIRYLSKGYAIAKWEYYQQMKIDPQGIDSPLLVCGSKDDSIIDRNALNGWYGYFKEGDRLWECAQGNHFFHYFYPQEVSRQILKFWRSNSQNSLNYVLQNTYIESI